MDLGGYCDHKSQATYHALLQHIMAYGSTSYVGGWPRKKWWPH